MLEEKSMQSFLDELASPSATPGGGSAAAIMGAMSAALVSMVCNLTIGRKNYESVEPELKSVLRRSEDLRRRLADMVRADIEAFNQVMGAYGLPKASETEKQARSEKIQDALKLATEVPLDCARACAELIGLSKTAAEKGNRNVVSDAGVAVLAGYAALKSAALNVYVNTGAIKDDAFVAAHIAELNRILEGADVSTEQIYQEVKGKL
jgi:formiminotetrahydrofolate cyclodeaminase